MRAFGNRLVGSLVLASVVTACSAAAEPTDASSVVVGRGDDTTSELLAEIYAGAIRSAGVTVSVTDGLGERGDYLAALDAGDVSLVPDFTGELLRTFDSTSTSTDAEDVFVDLNRSLPEGLSVGDYALAEDRIAVAVAPDGPLAELTTVSEFVDNRGRATWGVVGDPPDPDPMEVAMRLVPSGTGSVFEDIAVYVDADAATAALESGEIGALVFRTASLGPAAANLMTLEDEQSAFSAENVVPLMRTGTLNDAATATLSVVAGELTTADLADMIGEVRSGGESGDVAARWLGERNL